MSRFVDLAGKRFGKLLVLNLAGRNKWGGFAWECQCDCGGTKIVASNSLMKGNTKSCGCIKTEMTTARWTIHGESRNRSYKTWHSMKNRCLNEKDPEYHNYGGRGIKVCDRWMTVENFIADMGERPPGLEIDRINNDGNYEPGNCRWANRSEQLNNTRRTHKLTYEGKTLSLTEWAKSLNMPFCRLQSRIKRGWPIERALTTPAL